MDYRRLNSVNDLIVDDRRFCLLSHAQSHTSQARSVVKGLTRSLLVFGLAARWSALWL